MVLIDMSDAEKVREEDNSKNNLAAMDLIKEAKLLFHGENGYYKEIEGFPNIETPEDPTSTGFRQLDKTLNDCRKAINRISGMIVNVIKMRTKAVQHHKLAKRNLDFVLAQGKTIEEVKAGKDVGERTALCEMRAKQELELCARLEYLVEEVKGCLEVLEGLRDNYNEIRKDISTNLNNARVMAMIGELSTKLSPKDLEL